MLLIPFARRVADGALVSPSDVVRGASCGCVCVACRKSVIARQGDEKVWHFSHAQASDCADGYIRAVIDAAVQLITNTRKLRVTGLAIVERAVNAFGEALEHQEAVVCESVVEISPALCTPKVNPATGGQVFSVIFGSMPCVVHIGLASSRAIMGALSDWTGQGVINIDLSCFSNMQADIEALTDALFDVGVATWAYHPDQTSAEQRAREQIKLILAKDDSEYRAQKAKEYAANAAQLADKQRLAELQRLQDPNQKLVWRASLPESAQVDRALNAFAFEHTVSAALLCGLVGRIKSRAWLAREEPAPLIKAWAHEIGITTHLMTRLMHDAGYLL